MKSEALTAATPVYSNVAVLPMMIEPSLDAFVVRPSAFAFAVVRVTNPFPIGSFAGKLDAAAAP